MAGEEKFGYFCLSEGTEGEDGCLSSGCSWLEVLCEWRWKLTTDCSSFVCEKSGKVISCDRSGGGGEGGQRRELNVLKRLHISGALLILLWKVRIWQCGLLWRKMKATIDTYSGPTDRLIWTIFSLPLGVWFNVHEEHQITRRGSLC